MGGEKKKTVWGRVLGLYTTSKLPFRYGAWTLSILAVLALAYLFFSLQFLDRVYPNVVVGSNKLSGLTLAELKDRLSELSSAQADQKITLKQGDNTLDIFPKDISWQVDIDSTANQIFSYGREDRSRLTSFFHQLRSPFIKTDFDPVANYDKDLLGSKISQIVDKVNNPATNASAVLVSDKLVVTTERDGEVVDLDAVDNQALALLNGFTGGTVEMVKQIDTPKVILAGEADLNIQLEDLSGRKLTVKWEGGSRSLSRKEIRQLVGFVGETLEGVKPQLLSAQFTTEKVQNYLTSISDQTDSPAVEPQLTISDGKLTIVKTSREGKVVDLKASAVTILEILENQGDNPTANLTMKVDTPEIDESNLANLSIKERIGYGETNMRNSPANRRHNIANGISLLSSALVKPGEEFSAVAKLGAVDNTTGFLPELVIKDDRTVPEFGGGLCQVSTTLFRTVMNAGLKITERKNHSYRVSYYEPPIGLDATIYLPKPDFRFLNDTPGYILIQGRVVGNKVIFELWGTSDGRTSSISTPVVTNIIEPPPPIYVDSDTLPLGETKITDHAHQGATAVAHYTVTRNGQVINQQTFKSVYKALPERSLHGTNPDLPPTNPSP